MVCIHELFLPISWDNTRPDSVLNAASPHPENISFFANALFRLVRTKPQWVVQQSE